MSISFLLFSFREQRQPVVVFAVFRGLQYGGRRDIFPRMLTTRQKHIAQVLGCLTLVYISWGSCFISIKFAIESFPPFMMCGLRMMLAGVLLYLWSWARGERNLPTRKDLSQSFVLAFFNNAIFTPLVRRP